jgi:hypothetical protein
METTEHKCEHPKRCKAPVYYPAIPPNDYKGTQADWMIGLCQRGLWDETGFYGDVEITCCDYWDLLEECER